MQRSPNKGCAINPKSKTKSHNSTNQVEKKQASNILDHSQQKQQEQNNRSTDDHNKQLSHYNNHTKQTLS
jgi:hypothetical protein